MWCLKIHCHRNKLNQNKSSLMMYFDTYHWNLNGQLLFQHCIVLSIFEKLIILIFINYINHSGNSITLQHGSSLKNFRVMNFAFCSVTSSSSLLCMSSFLLLVSSWLLASPSTSTVWQHENYSPKYIYPVTAILLTSLGLQVES